MALLNVGDVVQQVATLMDDPAQTVYSEDYIVPLLNARWSDLTIGLVALGLQFQEVSAELAGVPAGTSSLTSYTAAGQPLAAMMSPVAVEWKEAGASAVEYEEVTAVEELDDVPAVNVVPGEYTWIGGTLAVTPCSVPVDLRVRFNAMSTTLVDPASQIIVGIGTVLAYRTAELVWMIAGGDGGKMQANMKQLGDDAYDSFCALSVQRQQAIRTRFPSLHPRRTYGWGYATRF